VRVDAGFIVGDEVSAHYDPMIAKLIVQGLTRPIAIQKLQAALEKYEIAGLVTNIEFLKKVCVNRAFMAGDVETGFITKQKDDLFIEAKTGPEVYAQAALGAFLRDAVALQSRQGLFALPQSGFGTVQQKRSFRFTNIKADNTASAVETAVDVEHVNTGLFNVRVDGNTYSSVGSKLDSENRVLTSFFPHTRLETRIIDDENNLTIFQQGKQYRLRCTTPTWVEKALGIKDTANSVLAPMPCKVLRVKVNAGDLVKKDQVLVVIESMKMETVIRSPQDGVVSRVVHQEGVSRSALRRYLWLI
jgi:3-methylcrotonyl-CoA carboxylase alpha subunit